MRFATLLPTPSSIAVILALATPLGAQIQRSGRVNETYTQFCASCHGANMQGGLAPSMLDDVWTYGGDDESLARSIRDGIPEKGMPPWSAAMSEKDIRAMVIYIREQHARAKINQTAFARPADSLTVRSELHAYQLNTWVDNVNEPWSLAFLSASQALVTEKRGRLFEIIDGKRAAQPVRDVPEVDSGSQAGLFDVVPHPAYAGNGWLYFAYSDPQRHDGRNVSLTRVIRGRLRDGALVDQETVYQAPLALYPRAGGVHYGGRIAFDRAGFLYFTIGERGHGANAQNLKVPMGKVHRIHDDGRIPADNPFASDPASATIWSYGHRNPQGLAFHPVTDVLYDAEHGPRGGDEINLVQRGLNYGWPVITHGMNYDGSAMTDITAREGMEQPLTHWTPSLAVCGMNFYTGDLFPKWKNHLFVASLAAEELRRLEIDGDRLVAQEVIFKGIGRIRHVIAGPDGAIYVLLPDRIARLTPAD